MNISSWLSRFVNGAPELEYPDGHPGKLYSRGLVVCLRGESPEVAVKGLGLEPEDLSVVVV